MDCHVVGVGSDTIIFGIYRTILKCVGPSGIGVKILVTKWVNREGCLPVHILNSSQNVGVLFLVPRMIATFGDL